MTLLKMSAQGGVMILLVVLLRAAARRQAPKKIFPALWGLVCLCLLCPFRLTVALPVPLPEPPAMAAPSPIPFAPPETAAVGDTVSRPAPVPAGGGDAAELLPVLWAVVAAGVALYFVSTHLYYRRKYRAAAPVEDGPVRDWLAAHPLRRQVTVRRSTQVASPLTYGVFRPVILLPANFPTEGEGLAFVLEHELAHIKRWDVAQKWMLALAVSVHWFNPLVWVMYVLANRDMELACDEAVTRPMKRQEKAAYLMSLLNLAERRSGAVPLGNSFGKSAIKERVMAMVNAKKSTTLGKAATAAALVLVAAAGLLTVDVAAETPPPVPTPAQTAAPVPTPTQAAPAPTASLAATEQREGLHIPTKEWILEHGYPTNDLGETYGPDIRELDHGPELILAADSQGLLGYLRWTEFPGASVRTPEEAMEYMENRSPEGTWLNVYLQDGVTVVGKFFAKGS